MYKKKVTIYDIAGATGISVGTVFRALHNTGRISDVTKKKVLDTAENMGYQANHIAQALRRNPIYIGAILCCPVAAYLDEIKKGMESAFNELSQFNVFGDIRTIYGENSNDCVDEIKKIIHEFAVNNYSGTALFLSGNNEVFVQDIDDLAKNGIVIGTAVNDFNMDSVSVHVSVDGQCAGMLAAEILSLSLSKKSIAILTGSKSTPIHRENINGFLMFAKNHPFECIDIIEHNDIDEIFIKRINEILVLNHYNGIYITSACSSEVCQSLKKAFVSKDMKIITTDLFEENKELLKMGISCATIYQYPMKQGKTLVHDIYKLIINKGDKAKIKLIPQAVFSSNMNAFDSTL